MSACVCVCVCATHPFPSCRQVFGIIFTICQGKIIDTYGTLPGNIFLCVFLLIGAGLTGERSNGFGGFVTLLKVQCAKSLV